MTLHPYPYLRVRFSIQGYQSEELALVDTGCDFPFVIPETLVERLVSPVDTRRAVTASGQHTALPTYVGTIELVEQQGLFTTYIVALGNEYLLGLPALNRYRVTFDHGRRLILEP